MLLQGGKTIGYAESLTQIGADDARYGALNAVTLMRLDLAFAAFLRSVKKGEKESGFPRFKAYDRFSGFNFIHHGDGFRVYHGTELAKRQAENCPALVRCRSTARLQTGARIAFTNNQQAYQDSQPYCRREVVREKHDRLSQGDGRRSRRTNSLEGRS